MVLDHLKRLQRFIERVFPERHVFIRSHSEVKAVLLSTRKQAAAAGIAAVGGLWVLACTTIVLTEALSPNPADRAAQRVQAYYERLTADRQAKLNSAMAQLGDTNRALSEFARNVETRHEALALLLTEAKGAPGAAQALAPAPIPAFANANPLSGVRAVEQDQDRLIDRAEAYAKTRADRLRLALRLAGLDPAAFSPTDDEGLGGPLIDARDPRALAVVLDVDPGFAERIRSAATDLSDMRALTGVAAALPLAAPTLEAQTHRSSGFGVRIDPFTGERAFHPGLDFAGPMYTPVYATAPGVVSFTGPRNGYGNVVEIDHGHGLKTRFGHLAAIYVSLGQRVAIGTKLGGIGSTGRSTGPHLHYEVWVDGRLQNPERFLEAGQYVHQATTE